MLQTLFALEHNAVCDRLAAAYPTWNDELLFQRGRLITAALLAKIHTVEWTPAIVAHRTSVTALHANWYGLAAAACTASSAVSPDEVVSGIPGSATQDYGVPTLDRGVRGRLPHASPHPGRIRLQGGGG